MPLFSRKPSREARLQKIYTEAYQSSLQSILKESSFEFRDSSDSWKQTLAHITSGMAQLDGAPPKTGQEKSLLASIMDIERQCHDRIAALETRLHNTSIAAGATQGNIIKQSPYGTNVANSSSVDISELSLKEKQKKPHRVAVGSKPAPRSDQVKSEPILNPLDTQKPVQSAPPPANTVSSTSPAPSSGSPVFDFTDQFTPHIPKVSEMPYKLYTKKHSKTPSQSAPLAKSAPVLGSESASSKQKKEQPPQHRSSLDYPQPAPAQHGHSMLTTLRSKNPLKSRNRANQASGSQSQHTPSPRNSAENIALTAAKQTAAAAAAPRAESPNLQQFSGFEGAFINDSQPASPTFNNTSTADPQGLGLHSNHGSMRSTPSPKVSLTQQQQLHPQQPLAATNTQTTQSQTQQQPSSTSQSIKKTQFQVAYEKVPTATGRVIYRPRVIRTPVGPSASTTPKSATPPQSSSAGPSSTRSLQSQAQAGSKGSQSNVLADGKPEVETDSADLSDMDDWDRMVRQKIKELRGVDKNAAEQIVSEVVLKGDEVNWDDIAGLERAKASLKETVVYPFLRPDLFMGLREPVLGMLLFGPPGTGKTMLARAVATESKSTFFSISASSLTSKYMGESEKLVRALFQLAKALAPSIIFVDEIDSILTQRADSGEHEASRRIKNEFLVQWSDLQAAAAGKSNQDAEVKRVLVLGATNLPWAIDEAARRRFVRRQYIPLPEPFTRRVHLEKLLSHQKHALTAIDLAKLTDLTEGYSGSDLTALAKDAAMGPLRSLGDALLTTAPDQIRPMGMSDFVESMRSIRPSVSPEGLRAFEQWADMYGSSGA